MNNTLNYMHVPRQNLEYQYILNRQSSNEYLLNNITRTAEILNFIIDKTDKNESIDSVYDKFCALADPSSLPRIFCQNFETIMHFYLLERFGKMYNIFISEAEIKNIAFPIHTFCSDNAIVVLYSKKDLKQLINNISLYQYMYFNEKYFLMPRKGCNDDTESLLKDKSDKNTAELSEIQKTMDEIQKEGIFNSETIIKNVPVFSSYCQKINNNLLTKTKTVPEIKNTSNNKLTNNINSFDNNKKKYSIISEKLNSDRSQLQINFSEIWSAKNHIHLTYLVMITQILEISVRPILCTILTNTIEKNSIEKKIQTDQLYKEFLSSFTHSISIDLKAYTNHKENKSTDFVYPNIN